MTPENLNEEGQQVWQMLDALPIFATRVGFRTDSTDDERRFAEALFAVNEKWQELRGAVTA